MGTKIEWTARPGTKGETWNPVTGCTPISMGCQHCYAKAMAKRLQAMGQPKYRDRFKVALHPEELARPGRWRKPRTVFVCSMADLFHDDVPAEFVAEVFDVMDRNRQHTFIVLSKRAERMASWRFRGGWPDNVWAGVTVEHPDYLWRLDHLRLVPAMVRFVSMEPLLGSWFGDPWKVARGYLTRAYVHWVIVGAETGRGNRRMDQDSAGLIQQKCSFECVSFFFKRNGFYKPDDPRSRLLFGRRYEEWPDRTDNQQFLTHYNQVPPPPRGG